MLGMNTEDSVKSEPGRLTTSAPNSSESLVTSVDRRWAIIRETDVMVYESSVYMGAHVCVCAFVRVCVCACACIRGYDCVVSLHQS